MYDTTTHEGVFWIMCQIYFFINSTRCHFLTLPTIFIIFFNDKVCFAPATNPSFFLEISQELWGVTLCLGWVGAAVSKDRGCPRFHWSTAWPLTTKATTIFRNVGNYSANDTAWHCRTQDSYATRQWQPQNSQWVLIRINSSIAPSEYNMWTLWRSPSNRAFLLCCRLAPWKLAQSVYIFSREHNYCR
jgi:hypothetical protein